MKKTKRFWCHYEDLEEFRAGMWRKVAGKAERDGWLSMAVEFLSDSTVMVEAMRRVLMKWPTSCLYNFTNPSLNKPVWLAHAGACLSAGIPEEFMRLGYWELKQPDRDRADADARMVFAEWSDPRA